MNGRVCRLRTNGQVEVTARDRPVPVTAIGPSTAEFRTEAGESYTIKAHR
ncbi:hypothetical protein N6H14_23805 [Paenibacillus sp. CC-CFT747]|nr:hypothetical protein N6H14_23805 [Paenibacillus sp. CC-CFT747]